MQCALHCLTKLKLIMRLKTVLKDRPHEMQCESRSVQCRLFFSRFSVPNGDPLTRASNTGGIALFDQYLSLYLDNDTRYTYNGRNRKSYVRTAPFSMTLNHIFNSDLKVTPLFDAECLKTVRDTDTNLQ